MLQTRKTLSRKLQIFSAIALVGMPFLIYGTAITPEHAEAASTTLNDITTMQQMTASICKASTVGSTKTLTDTRDNSTYTVAKLADGNCWMTQNLRIVNKTITSSDSDVSSNFTIPASSASGFSEYDTANAYYGGDTTYGAYYSWYAATAGTGTQSLSSGNAASSICPKGWKLPEGRSSGDFQTLNTKYSGAWTTNNGKNGRWFGAASTAAGGAFFPAAGFYNYSSANYVGSVGRYWSRTAYNSNYAYHLDFDSSNVSPAGNDAKHRGSSVRCVAYSEPHDSGNVNVSVASTITIDATAGMTSEVEAATPATGNITARISANTPYKVLLGASTSNPGNKTSLYRRTDDMQAGTTPTYDISSNNHIPTVSGNASVAPSTVEANTNAWGISNSCNKDGSGLAYLPITTTQKEYCGSSIDEATLDSATGQNIHTFGIGISVSSSLASGTYETSVTVTGVAN